MADADRDLLLPEGPEGVAAGAGQQPEEVTLDSFFCFGETLMKLIVAIIQPGKLEAVQTALKPGEARLLSIGSVESGEQETGAEGYRPGRDIRRNELVYRFEGILKIERQVGLLSSRSQR